MLCLCHYIKVVRNVIILVFFLVLSLTYRHGTYCITYVITEIQHHYLTLYWPNLIFQPWIQECHSHRSTTIPDHPHPIHPKSFCNVSVIQFCMSDGSPFSISFQRFPVGLNDKPVYLAFISAVTFHRHDMKWTFLSFFTTERCICTTYTKPYKLVHL